MSVSIGAAECVVTGSMAATILSEYRSLDAGLWVYILLGCRPMAIHPRMCFVN